MADNKQHHSTPVPKEAEEMTRAVISLRPDNLSDRDYDILVFCLFSTESKASEKYKLSRDGIQAVKRRHRTTWRNLLSARDSVIPAMAKSSVFHGVKKLGDFMESKKSAPKDIRDASMLTQSLTQLAKLSAAPEPTETQPTPSLESAKSVIIDL